MAQKQETEILTKEQIKFLDLVSNERHLCKKFYFTGGTPLAAFYLHHRLSEDIDLFSEDEINLLPIRAFIKKAQGILKALNVDYRQFLGLHSFELRLSDKNRLKVDFNFYPFPRIEKGINYKNLSVDGLLDIAVNKTHTIAMKPRARDFIDLYFIVKKEKYNIEDLLLKAKAKFDWHIDPIQLGSRFLYAPEVTDLPRMIKKIDHSEWQQFFVKEAEKLKKEIFQ